MEQEKIPLGLIAMWSGAAGAIPGGWVICDGTNGTPNLQSKFVLGGSATGTTSKTNILLGEYQSGSYYYVLAYIMKVGG